MGRVFLAAMVIGGLVLSSICFGYSGGSGTPEEPYQIANKEDLLALAADTSNYDKCFILTADINMGGQVFTKAIIAADTSPSWDFQGTAFTGAFDGNSHKITNFTINGGSNYFLGLFGYIDAGGAVKNLGIENCAVSGVSDSYYVGGLVGWNVGSIRDCYSTGTVSGGSNSWYVGGLVGRNNGSISNCYSTGSISGYWLVGGVVGWNYSGSISNCYSTGTVSGSINVGGLVGGNSGSISQCYSTGTVSGSSGSYYIGGLVGGNGGSLSDCYSTGEVSGSYCVGGLVGGNNGSLSDCYSTGEVSGSYSGGLVGDNTNGSVISSFWDTQTSSQTTSAGGTGKTTAEMKTLLTFTSAGWDFVDTWNIGENQTYPFLRKYFTGDLNYDGSVDFVDFAIFAQHWLE